MSRELAREAITRRDEGLCPLPLVYREKIPPKGVRLAAWTEREPSDAMIERAFRGRCNIGMVLGDVSGGLACRDFDRQDSYRRWAARNPDLARVLPTVETHRGRHVYFTCTRAEVTQASPTRDSEIIRLDDGELRRRNHIVWPGSLHPLGIKYRWVLPPGRDGFPFVADVLDAGLLPDYALHRGGVYTRDIPGPGHGSGDPSGAGLTAKPKCGGSEIGAWDGVTVTDAIRATLPAGTGERHYRLFDFVRMLRAIPETRDAEPEALESVVVRWYREALPYIGTHSFLVTWREFLDAWRKVRSPYGATMRAIAAGTDGVGIEKLADLCRLLQAKEGGRPFHLDCRTAGKMLGVSHVTANDWLNELRSQGRLRLATEHDRFKRRSREWAYIGGS